MKKHFSIFLFIIVLACGSTSSFAFRMTIDGSGHYTELDGTSENHLYISPRSVAGTLYIGVGRDASTISDLSNQVNGDIYSYTGAITDDVEITADNVTVLYPGHSIPNTGTLTFSGEGGYVKGVLFSGAITGEGANGNVYHPTNPRRGNRMGMNP